uniref:Uncharacterized protein n=1 Tax=Globisporangium ultimum (strain ATCC 200006 / CBS 805.95 / DAOM BR144) TaxID=431595 RepID=K3W8Y6_GLOUD
MQQVTKENERLRLLVRVQKKHAKDLRRILKKRIARATTVEYSLLRPARCMELGESPDDYNVYAK